MNSIDKNNEVLVNNLFVIETEERLEMVQVAAELANSVCADDTTIKAV
jgi:hypothetical protein